MEQGSELWLRWRRGVIGSSDAATIMGENPWSSPAYLMKEKLGLNPPFKGNAATREGQRLERSAREALIKEANFNLIPLVVQDGKSPYVAASLDAISENFDHLFANLGLDEFFDVWVINVEHNHLCSATGCAT